MASTRERRECVGGPCGVGLSWGVGGDRTVKQGGGCRAGVYESS
jgi:hypothetical protein